MTIATNTNLVWRASTPAEHFAWMKLISDAFDAIGWAKTTDTGQIELTGPTMPLPANMTSYSVYYEAGYQIRRLAAPGLPTIYCRIGYGVNRGSFETNNNSNFPQLRFQFATGTDGAGNLQGMYAPGSGSHAGYPSGSMSTPGSARPFYFSSDGANYLTLLIDPMQVGSPSKGTNSILNMVLERTINAETDAYDGDGWTAIDTMETAPSPSGPSNERTTFQSIPYKIYNIAAGLWWGGTPVPVQAPTHINTSGVAGVTPLFPVTVMCPQIKGPMGSVMYHFRSDIMGAVTFKTRVYGVDRTFMSIGAYNTGNSVVQPSLITYACRFE